MARTETRSETVPRDLLAALKTLRQGGLNPTVVKVTANPRPTRPARRT